MRHFLVKLDVVSELLVYIVESGDNSDLSLVANIEEEPEFYEKLVLEALDIDYEDEKNFISVEIIELDKVERVHISKI